MLNSRHLFSGGVNGDDNPRFLAMDELLNLENVRVGVYAEGQNYVAENIPSSILKYNTYPAGTNLTIGRATDYGRLRLVWFNHNSNGNHGIYAYDIQLDTTYIVLLSSQTEEGLNFSTSNRIDRNARVIGDLLFWTDNNNEPQCINMERGIKLNQPAYQTNVTAYATPIPYTTLTVIQRPPIYRLQVAKITDTSFESNFIATNAYQFAYRYWYKDYQYSVISTYSQLLPLNNVGDTFNAITVALPFGEDIDDYVQQVDIVVRYGNFGKSFVIKSWNKDYYYDRLAIESHNNNLVQLGFTFYDNQVGIALDDITANTAFDDVALKAKTPELARNRLFLANVLKGYSTPTVTSLSATVGEFDSGGGGTFLADWKYFELSYRNDTSGSINTVTYYYAWASGVPAALFFSEDNVTEPPELLNSSAATYSASSENALAYYILRNTPPPTGTHWVFTTITFHETGFNTNVAYASDTSITGLNFFKSSSIYRVSVAFFDRYRRKCGVIQRIIEVAIPDRATTQVEFSSTINWALTNDDTLNEIPDWAYYYQIHITKSLTTRFFVQVFANASDYVLKNQDGTYSYGHTTFAANSTYATALDITALFSFGQGYTFSEGDYCRIYFPGSPPTNKNISVIGQDGNFVFLSPTDIGTTGSALGFLIELYTPYKPSVTEPFYETGDMMQILNPTTVDRQYSVLSGAINGDCYAIQRAGSYVAFYYVETMSPNDNVWQIWQTDRGWTNIYDYIGQQLKETAIDWSDTYINGTKTNGLNKFQPLNTKDIGNTSGAIQKLQLANKTQENGNVMIIIATEEPLSAYLGEVQLYAAAQAADVATTDSVIGTINALKNSFGTINPSSVVMYNGVIWWFDAINGVIAQYAQDGVTPVSKFKMHRFWDKYAKRYIEQGAAAIEALCGFSYIDSCVDPSTGEVSFTLPQTETNAVVSGIPVGYAPELPSYTTLPSYASSIQNRFDFYDGQPKMVIYKYEQNKWFGAYQWLPDCQEFVGNKLYAWKNGALYLMNEIDPNNESYNTIFGVTYPQRFCLSSNAQNPSMIKDVADIAVEGNDKPNYSVCYTDYPNEQITDLTEDNYTNKEGIQNATWLRDRLSPKVTGNADMKMYMGDNIKAAAPRIMVEFQIYNSKFILNFIDIGFNVSRGHSQLSGKIKP